MSEKMKNTSFLISETEEKKLLRIVEYFNKSSLSKLTKSDILRYLINKECEELGDKD